MAEHRIELEPGDQFVLEGPKTETPSTISGHVDDSGVIHVLVSHCRGTVLRSALELVRATPIARVED